jgi:hypothetical protein
MWQSREVIAALDEFAGRRLPGKALLAKRTRRAYRQGKRSGRCLPAARPNDAGRSIAAIDKRRGCHVAGERPV